MTPYTYHENDIHTNRLPEAAAPPLPKAPPTPRAQTRPVRSFAYTQIHTYKTHIHSLLRFTFTHTHIMSNTFVTIVVKQEPVSEGSMLDVSVPDDELEIDSIHDSTQFRTGSKNATLAAAMAHRSDLLFGRTVHHTTKTGIKYSVHKLNAAMNVVSQLYYTILKDKSSTKV